MRAEATAMLWESWRLTRRGMAFGVLIAIIGGSAILLSDAEGDLRATIVLLLITILSLPASRWVGLERGGFPFYLGYVRPVPTWLLVGVPMAYHAASCAVLYLTPMIVLRTAFGIPFPLLPVAASIAAIRLVFTTCLWWTKDSTMQKVGLVSAAVLAFSVMRRLNPVNLPGNDFPPDRWADMFAFSLADYGLIAFVMTAAIGVTIVGVARQRRGDDQFSLLRNGVGVFGFPAIPRWFGFWFQAPCPTSSPVKAQLWMEMKSTGVPVLSIGVMLAMGIPVLLLAANAYQWDLPVLFAMLSFLPPVKIGLLSMFRIQRKQGTAYMSAFDATCALGTAQLVGLKMAVTVMCILGAWVVIGTSLWFSLSIVRDFTNFGPMQRNLAGTLAAQPGYRLAALAAVASIQLSAIAAFLAAGEVFFVLHAKRVLIGVLGVVLYVLVSVFAVTEDWVGPSFVEAHAWAIAVLIPIGAVWVFRRALADRMFTGRQTGAAVLTWAAFATVYLAFLRESGSLQSEMPSAFIALMVSLSLAPLAAVALAPWSFGLIRHR